MFTLTLGLTRDLLVSYVSIKHLLSRQSKIIVDKDGLTI